MKHGDVFDSQARCIALTIAPDTLSRGSGEIDPDRLFGNVGRKFLKIFPDVWPELSDNIQEGKDEILKEGQGTIIDVSDSPFDYVLLLNTLSHRPGAHPKQLSQRAAASGLLQAFHEEVFHIAITPLTGGWRMNLEDGFFAIVSAFRQALAGLPKAKRGQVCLELWSYSDEQYTKLCGLFSKL